jgi:hypothetical protein
MQTYSIRQMLQICFPMLKHNCVKNVGYPFLSFANPGLEGNCYKVGQMNQCIYGALVKKILSMYR